MTATGTGHRTRHPFVWLAAGLGVVLVVITVIVALRRASSVAQSPAAADAPRPTPAPVAVAETTGEEGTLSIAVVSLGRVSSDIVELRLAVANTAASGSPPLDLSQRFSADVPDSGTIAEVYLADQAHQQKFFVLRDAANAPLGSRDVAPLRAGERRVLWARYPAPAGHDAEVVVHVPHAEPMPNVPVGR
ncbi:MAG: hypothetical protein H0V80_06510 [Acidobacteria bacterium]|nr:hypothetical protein [Acidobacteriota bacterium]